MLRAETSVCMKYASAEKTNFFSITRPFESVPVYTSSAFSAPVRLNDFFVELNTGVSTMPLMSNWLLKELSTATF